jgi:ribosomal protein L40E
MATKDLGFIELEWACPRCGTRNPGPQKACTNCGAAQPDNVKFEAPQHAEILKDEKVAQRVKAGPDVHCPYCDARNPGDAKVCVQCGAALAGAEQREAGAVVGAFQTGPAPEITCAVCGAKNPAKTQNCTRCGAPIRQGPVAAVKPKPAPVASGGNAWLWIVGAIVALLLIVGAFILFSSRTETVTGTADQARWERTIEVLGLAPVKRQAWHDQLPGDADVQSCERSLRFTSADPAPGAVEVCGTPYTVDTGTGYGEVKQDCEYQVYEDLCTYTVLQWMAVDTLRLEGIGFSPQWPAFSTRNEQREGSRSEQLICTVKTDGETYSFQMDSFEEYQACQPGSEWEIEVNPFGSVISATPK